MHYHSLPADAYHLHMLVLNMTFSNNTITNLMVYYPQWGAPYSPDLILHGEQIKISVNPIKVLSLFQTLQQEVQCIYEPWR